MSSDDVRNYTSLNSSQSVYLFGLTEPVQVPYDETRSMRVIHVTEHLSVTRHHGLGPEAEYRVRISGYPAVPEGTPEEWEQVEYAEGAVPDVLTPHLCGTEHLLEILRIDIAREAELLGTTSTTLTATID